MRETPDRALRDGLVRQTSSYPLIPYSNRIAQGRFSFEGVEHQLALNFGDHPHSIHGNAWQKPWQVAEVERCTHCRLSFLHRPVGDDARGWPFAYRAEQMLRADRLTALRITLTLRTWTMTAPCRPAWDCTRSFQGAHGFELQFAAANRLSDRRELRFPRDAFPCRRNGTTVRARAWASPVSTIVSTGWDGSADILFEEDKIALRLRGRSGLRPPRRVCADRTGFFRRRTRQPSERRHQSTGPGSSHGLKVLQPGERLDRHRPVRRGGTSMSFTVALDLPGRARRVPSLVGGRAGALLCRYQGQGASSFRAACRRHMVRFQCPRTSAASGPREGGGFIAGFRSGLWLLDRAGRLDAEARRQSRGSDARAGSTTDASIRPGASSPERSTNPRTAAKRISIAMIAAVWPCWRVGLLTSNGVAFSPDGRTLYHADTPTFTVWRYAYDPATGEATDRTLFVRLSPTETRSRASRRRGCRCARLLLDGAVRRWPDTALCARRKPSRRDFPFRPAARRWSPSAGPI